MVEVDVISTGELVVEEVVASATGVDEVVVYVQSDQVWSMEEVVAVVSRTGVSGVVVVVVYGTVVVLLVVASATGVELVPPSTGTELPQSPQVCVPLSRRKWNFSCL